MSKTYLKHVHDSAVQPPPPDLHTMCRKIVPPSEIATRIGEITCEKCRDLWNTAMAISQQSRPRMK